MFKADYGPLAVAECTYLTSQYIWKKQIRAPAVLELMEVWACVLSWTSVCMRVWLQVHVRGTYVYIYFSDVYLCSVHGSKHLTNIKTSLIMTS